MVSSNYKIVLFQARIRIRNPSMCQKLINQDKWYFNVVFEVASIDPKDP